ncbi:coiled-coil domain-containing protein 130-like protein [Plakobranchus ocellatus]|uniref:Coiled-coil domain-containing protein 130-like protein n=1 Tax=Plakobranchus ocellatus TaxID=259542 RepID=A0AAV3YDI3_9GAST|nr:coiled-coil domain-containing protein 130-like protein [Plakobranchus ocellatus]
MAERKAVNKYYPPDWDPRKGSVNKRVGQHPLRDRAKKLSQGILVIRFELPYNIWCGGCGIHIGMGVRYNAEKSKVGNYYSTPIYKFRMKCHLCDNYFEIQTDPKNHDYVILSGARRKEQRWDPVANGQIMPEDKATQKKLATDPMYKLEHGSDDHQKGKEQVSSLAELEETRISMIDDYLLNRMARDKFRSEKRQLREAAEADKAILDKASLDLDLLEESEEDKKLAGLLKYSVTTSFEDKQKERRKSIEQRPLFSEKEKILISPASTLVSSMSTYSKPLPYQRHVAPKFSRRGEIKQKLGWAIKASYRDPFKSSRNKANTLPLPANAIQKQLGIKLKSPTHDRQSLNPTKSDSSSSAPVPLSVNETTNLLPEKQKDSSLESSAEQESLSINLGQNCVEASANDIRTPPSSDRSLSCESPHDAHVKPNSSSSTSSQQTEHTNELEAEGVASTSNSSNIEETNDGAGVSNTSSDGGLQTLMSSYGGSDSDSSD